ncbi:MAG TPA: glutamate synthase-related protein [Woeseiaceae bacterium]|nr:glutamate synthase-related protein [Woeseiaceae bacterium]
MRQTSVATATGLTPPNAFFQALQCNRNTCPTGITTHNKRLQRRLVVTDKAERVANYARYINQEVAVIAHSCGVPEPRRLRRFHCRVVMSDGRSVPLNELYPDATPAARAA